ncbi:hypothetical protein [Virgibacillus salinus]|uniref:Uncharacterized protein n=1 Tax=Virgibacillus salinus TaxID=553311 RepID=A0A1H1BWX7_9BACI|nr:hypothetical protein [Virgibacillus salinus]SDQ56391.1 hypothetical protein SAMN05216231_1954 [Virgibacillus salinus]
MIKKRLMLFLLIGLYLTGCSNLYSPSSKAYYVGESENWKIVYDRDKHLVIEYIGDEPIPQEKIEISRKYKEMKFTKSFPLSEKGKQTIGFQLSEEPTSYEITIHWEEHTESLNLKEM